MNITTSAPLSMNAMLSNLVALTHERDEAALEVSLLRALHDLIATAHVINTELAMYHLKEVDSETSLTVLTINHPRKKVKVSSYQLGKAIVSSFNSGEISTYQSGNESAIKFYPIKNISNQTVSVIAIEAQLTDDALDITIGLLLKVYQNFTALINDNMYDTLTGLLNRKTFDHRVHKILAKMQNAPKRSEDSQNQEYYLAIFDIDRFKRINDQFGHLIGDEVLLMFSQLMSKSYRETDPLFRFGGEEFVGVFECHSESDIEMILERLRKKVADFDFPQVGKVTVSAGYTKITAYDVPSQLVGRADTALYYAKNNGRNRIDSYEKLIESGELKDSNKEGDIELF